MAMREPKPDLPAMAHFYGYRRLDLPIFGFKRSQRSGTMFAVNVEDNQPTCRACDDSDVGVGPFQPPLEYVDAIYRRVFETARRSRCLPRFGQSASPQEQRPALKIECSGNTGQPRFTYSMAALSAGAVAFQYLGSSPRREYFPQPSGLRRARPGTSPFTWPRTRHPTTLPSAWIVLVGLITLYMKMRRECGSPLGLLGLYGHLLCGGKRPRSLALTFFRRDLRLSITAGLSRPSELR